MPNVVISYSPFFCGTFYRGAHHQKSSKDFLLLNCFWHFCFAYISHAIAFQKAKLDKFHMAVCVCVSVYGDDDEKPFRLMMLKVAYNNTHDNSVGSRSTTSRQ